MSMQHENTIACYQNGRKLYGWAQSLKRYCIKEKKSSNLTELLIVVVENTDFGWSQRKAGFNFKFSQLQLWKLEEIMYTLQVLICWSMKWACRCLLHFCHRIQWANICKGLSTEPGIWNKPRGWRLLLPITLRKVPLYATHKTQY